MDAFVCALAIGLVDARDLMIGHGDACSCSLEDPAQKAEHVSIASIETTLREDLILSSSHNGGVCRLLGRVIEGTHADAEQIGTGALAQQAGKAQIAEALGRQKPAPPMPCCTAL
jgi:hypothetical protein